MKSRLGWALLVAAALAEAREIRAIALFPQRAMLEIDGTQRLLRVGETSPEGVKLLASDSRRARVEVAGKPIELELSQHVASRFSQAQYAEVRVPRDAQGHYYVGGDINGHGVEFMVDTGATMIAMNSIDADRLGLPWQDQPRSATSTAGGVVPSHAVTLAKVSVGGITVREVPAVVVVGRHPPQVLLGNSFLTKVEMTEDAGTLVLRQKY